MAIWVEDTKVLPRGKQKTSFGMDSMDDVPRLPPLSDKVWQGSKAFSVVGKKLVMLGSDGIWK